MDTETYALKTALAEMLKGGVILDVTNAEQARIAEDAGAAAVMALERVPADIRREGGVARMAAIERIEEVRAAVSIPVMAKCRIGHFVEARVLEALGVDFIDESEVLTPADDEHHVDKHAFRVPFVCGARDLGEALRRIGEGAAHDPHQGRGGERQHRRGGAPPAPVRREIRRLDDAPRRTSAWRDAKALGAPYELVVQVAEHRPAAGAELRRRRHRHARRRRALHGARRRGGVRRLGHLQVGRPGGARARHRARDDALAGCGRGAGGVARARRSRCAGSRWRRSPTAERLAARGW